MPQFFRQGPKPTVRYGGVKIKLHRDYELYYDNNIDTGTAQIYVIGCGLYINYAYRNFEIVPRSIAKASVKTPHYSYSYTGNPRCPSVTVRLGGRALRQGTDYTVSYQKNTGPGRGIVKVMGRGNYKGTASCKSGISKRVASIKPGYSYILVPKAATDRAVALKNGGMVNNTRLWINTRTCSEAQEFKINRNSDGTFLFVNKNSGKVLSAEKSAAKHAALNMHTRSNSTAQRFYLERVSDKVVTHAQNGLFSLRAKRNTGFTIDVPAASKKSGTKLQIYKYNGSKAQQFRFIYSGDGTYRIVNRNSGKVLMPSGSRAVKGAAIVQEARKGTACQRCSFQYIKHTAISSLHPEYVPAREA